MIRSMLFLPGNTPNMLINGDALGADAVILDLEDAVSPQEKDAARILVRNALSRMGFGCRTVVRINALDSGLCQADLEEIVPQGPTALMLPKTANAGQIQQLDAEITRLEQQNGMKPGRVGVIALLETALDYPFNASMYVSSDLEGMFGKRAALAGNGALAELVTRPDAEEVIARALAAPAEAGEDPLRGVYLETFCAWLPELSRMAGV